MKTRKPSSQPPKKSQTGVPKGAEADKTPLPPTKEVPEPQSQADEVPDALGEESSQFTQSDVVRTLHESKKYSFFLLKVGFEWAMYFLALSATMLFVMLDVRRTRSFYRMAQLDIFMWLFLGASLTIKLVCSFVGPWIRILLKPFYFLDMACAVMFTLGLYYKLQESLDTAYYTYSPFVVIVVFNVLVATLLFSITTFFNAGSSRYLPFLGFLTMTVGTTATSVGLFFGWTNVVTITAGQYFWIIVAMAGFNFYFATNAWLVVTYRADDLLEHDSVLAFFNFWTDIGFFFWRDLLWGTKHKSFFRKLNRGLIGADAQGQDAAQTQPKPARRARVRDPNEITSSVASRVGGGDPNSQNDSVQIA